MPRLANTFPPKRLATAIGEACRAARLEAGLTQEDVADRVGLATEVYGRLERGNMTPSVPTLRKLCLVLHVSADAALSIDTAARLPPRSEAPAPSEGKAASPEHRRLIRRARNLHRKEVRLLGLLASALGGRAAASPRGDTGKGTGR